MADNWDLHAVVRGCASSNSPGNNPTEEALPDFDSLTFENDDSGPFCYSGFDEQNMNLKSHLGLEEIYLSFNSQAQPISPQFNDSTAGAGAPLTSQHFHSPPVRSRRRKNELQPKVVREMRQEDLMGDLWAWRKYGQKPIKGSPYPRNYYRCSTSKGCSARKQVEKSPTDPNIYVVCYSGDHTHPRPTHRNALAGGTRNRFSTSVESSEAQSSTATAAPNPSCSSLSPSLSPTTEGESVNSHGNDDVEMEGEDDILIPNPIMSEDILKGFEELWGGFYRSSDLDSRGGAAGGEFSTEGGDQ